MNENRLENHQLYMHSRDPFDPGRVPSPPEPVNAAWYIIQFAKPLTFDEQRLLRTQYGLRLADYLPNFAFLEWLTPERWQAIKLDPLYRASLPYEASDRISPRLLLKSTEASRQEAPLICAVLFPTAKLEDFLDALKPHLPRTRLDLCSRLRRLIRKVKAFLGLTKAAIGDEDVTGAVEALSGKKREPGHDGGRPDAEQLRVFDERAHGGDLQVILPALPPEKLLVIAKLKEVRWIEEEPEVNLDSVTTVENTPGGLIQSGLVGITPIWDKEIRGQGQVIGVTDHPINGEHCMFSDATSTSIGPGHRKVRGRRQEPFRQGIPGIMAGTSPHGHRVAALAAGHSRSGSLNRIRGMAWEARLSLDDLNYLTQLRINISQALRAQTADESFIHSNSWHIGCGYNAKAIEVDKFVFNNERHFVCGSSGNNGGGGECIGPPGSAKNAMCVSASLNVPSEMQFGDGIAGPISDLDRRYKPDICAPGGGLATAAASGNCKSENISLASSWATPIVAGAATLVRQYYLEGWYPTGTKKVEDSHDPSGALVKAMLLNSTVAMTRIPRYPSAREGWGLLRLNNTLFFADAGAPGLFMQDIFNANGLHTGESHTYEIDIKDDSRPLKVTLVWSDEAAISLATRMLVNDLDLIVTSPKGKTFLGNVFDANGLSMEGGYADYSNNVEMVILDRPLQGKWSITVRCFAANGETKVQGYALVVTAALAEEPTPVIDSSGVPAFESHNSPGN